MKKPRYTEQQIAQARAAAGGGTLHGRGVSRERPAVEMNTSWTSARVAAVLGRLVVERGAPVIISIDIGSAFYSEPWRHNARSRS